MIDVQTVQAFRSIKEPKTKHHFISILNPKTAIQILLGLLSLVLIFHFCILVKWIPYDITWGGRLKNDQEMYVFESISIGVNLFLIFLLLIKGKYLKAIIPGKIVNFFLWLFFFLFCLNTIGNLWAQTNFEKFFAIITILFSVLIWIILKGKKIHCSNSSFWLKGNPWSGRD